MNEFTRSLLYVALLVCVPIVTACIKKGIAVAVDALNELKGQIDELYEEEQEAFENIPESLQGTERYEVAENAVDMLESASSGLEDVISFLGDAEG